MGKLKDITWGGSGDAAEQRTLLNNTNTSVPSSSQQADNENSHIH